MSKGARARRRLARADKRELPPLLFITFDGRTFTRLNDATLAYDSVDAIRQAHPHRRIVLESAERVSRRDIRILSRVEYEQLVREET